MIHEYSAKTSCGSTACPGPRARWPPALEEADQAAKALFGKGTRPSWSRRSIHAGGRGKAVLKVTKPSEDADAASKAILGMQLVTPPDRARGARKSSGADCEAGFGHRPRALPRPGA